MTYERRLKIVKIGASLLLMVTVVMARKGLYASQDSAERALFFMSLIITLVGFVLLWSRLHGTGRSVRIAMALLMGCIITNYLTLGVELPHTFVFAGTLIAMAASIKTKIA